MPISTLDRDKVSAFGHGTDHADHAAPLHVRRNGKRQRIGNVKPMRFVSLHHHSTFSYLDGFQLPEAHARRAAELNMSAITMTEHGNISSHVKLEKACRDEKDEHKRPNPAYGIKPIFGVELYTGKVGKNANRKKFHLTVLAKDQEGYRNLLRLVSLSYSVGFYSDPTVDWNMLRKYKRGLIIMSGCQGSLLFCSLMGGKLVPEEDASYERAKSVAAKFKKEFGDNYFIEVQAFPELEKTRKANPQLARIAEELHIPLVGTMDCHYTQVTEAEIQKVLHNVRPGEKRTLEDLERSWGYNVPLCPPPNDNTILRKLRATGLSKKQAIEAVINTELIAQECNVELPRLPELEYRVPSGFKDAIEYWHHLLRKGWKYRGYDRLPRSEQRKAKRMLRKEVRIIEEKNFVHYLLVVRDGIVFAKDYREPPFEYGIPVGPGRGSAAASVACYLLRITEINPLLFDDLVFERFIDISRADPPDIDTDFASEGRHLVRDYYVAKYGEECVNNIGTFTYYKSKLALDDVAKVHHVPTWEVDKVKELLVERSSGDLRASATIEDTAEQFEDAGKVFDEYPELKKAMELEGNVKQFGVHAAGLVVSNGDIRDVCAVYEREVKKRIVQVVSMDKYDAERQNLLKLDFLGLSTLDMIAYALRIMGLPLTALYEIPLDDEKTIEGFIANDVVGIFQLDGRAARSVNGSLKADTFDEVCDVCALCRPGPLHNGAANEYIDIKRGVKKPEKVHPALDNITARTHYQIVYQEQILRIVRDIGGFDWTHASHIRKIISKKHGSAEFNREWERYWAGASTVHERFEEYPPMTEAIAQRIWGMCITAGSYAFNVAHSRCYGMLAWWTMWLKQHHPEVFYAASLAKMPNSKSGAGNVKASIENKVTVDRHASLMRDAIKGSAVRKPIEIKPPHPKRSRTTWVASKGSIRAGFEQLPKVGEVTAASMLEYADAHRDGKLRWEDFINVKGVGPVTIENITSFTRDEDPFGVTTLDELLANTKQELEELGLPSPTHTAAEVPYERGPDTEIVWIGMIMGRNLRDIFESNRARTGVELKPEEVKRPDLNEWCMLAGYDGEEIVTLRVDRFKYPVFRKAIWGIKQGTDLVLARGVKPGWRTAREIYVSELWVIDPEGDE